MHDRTIRVTIDSGVIEGFTADGVHRWRSIPYASPPVGRRRLRAPEPVQPWPGVRYCHGFTYCAPQDRKYTLLGVGEFQPMSEDCLTVNVVAPEKGSDEPLPVMFFIHGGGYILGSSATPIYDGAAMARRGCVYVSVNYRFGRAGLHGSVLVSTPENPIEDNLFLRDLVMALRWVRDNVAVFGGDPDNVTIFGESAGAHAVATLLATPAAKGLFSQAISESPASGMAGPPDVAAAFADDLVDVLGVARADGAAALMAARPVAARRRPEPGDEPRNEGDARRLRRRPHLRHRLPPGGSGAGDAQTAPRTGCRSSSAPTPTRAACSPGSSSCCPRPSPRSSCSSPTRTSSPGSASPAPIPDIRSRAPAFAWAATSPSGRPRGRSPPRTAGTPRRTSTGTTTRRAPSAGRGWAPPMPPSCSPCSTSTGRRFGSLMTAAADRRSARRVSNDVQAVARVQPHRSARRRLAAVHRRRARGHGLRQAFAPGIRPQRRPAPGVGGFHARRDTEPPAGFR